MTPWLRRSAPFFCIAAALTLTVPFSLGEPVPQRGNSSGSTTLAPQQDEDAKLPNGKSQKDEILKSEFEQNTKDAAQLTELAQQLQQDIEKNGYSVVSMSTLKKTDDIEKLVKKIRSRMRHY